MNDNNSVVDFRKVSNMLDGDPAYLKEFCEAAVISFSTFKRDFKKHMLDRNLENLRKAGHRIKPVAQMMGVEQLNDEYEQAKIILQNNTSEKEIKASIKRVDLLCEQILSDFYEKID